MAVGNSWVRLAGCLALTGLLALSAALAHPELDWQIAQLTARIEAGPDDPQLYLQRGELHRIHRDWSAAESDYRRARKLQPDLTVVDYYLGRMKLEAGHPKQAKKLLDRFLAKEPDRPKALVARARVLSHLGQPLAAARDYTRALDAFGEDQRPDPSYYLERARALTSAGSEYVDDAVRGLDEGLARLGQPVTLQLRAIELEVECGRYDAALARLDLIASRADRKESWLLRRAEVLERAGRVDEARRAYAAALDAIETLPFSRSGSRATLRLKTQAATALERLDAGRPEAAGTDAAPPE
jgi:tetratricopeptide (TPR) repeat protein